MYGIFTYIYHKKQPHRIHVWYIYLHLPLKKSTIHVGKYTVRPMDPSWAMIETNAKGTSCPNVQEISWLT